MKVEWFKDCKNEDEKQERREVVLSAGPILEVLRMILARRLADKTEDRKKRKMYDNPNWALVQADLTGAERELEELLDLMTLEERE